MSHSRAQQGFTLVELLVVIAIIATLAGLLVPSVMMVQEKMRKTSCLHNLSELGRLSFIYSHDHRDLLPVARGEAPPAYASLQILVDEGLIPHPRFFVCPSSNDDLEAEIVDGTFTLDETSCSYAWIGRRLKTNVPQTWPLGSDDSYVNEAEGILENHRNGLNVVYVGMNAEWVPRSELPEGRTLPERLVNNLGEGG